MSDEKTDKRNGQHDQTSADHPPHMENDGGHITGFAIDRARVERANVRLTEKLREPGDAAATPSKR